MVSSAPIRATFANWSTSAGVMTQYSGGFWLSGVCFTRTVTWCPPRSALISSARFLASWKSNFPEFFSLLLLKPTPSSSDLLSNTYERFWRTSPGLLGPMTQSSFGLSPACGTRIRSRHLAFDGRCVCVW